MEFKTNHKSINIEIDGKEYAISLYLSAGDVLSILDFLNGSNRNYKVAVSKIIEKHISPNQPENSLVYKIAAEQVVLETYIEEIVAEEEGIMDLYNKYQNDTDICRRFIYAVNDKWKELAQKSAVAVANVIEGHLSAIKKHPADILNGLSKTASIIAKAIEPYTKISEKITKTVNAINNQISAIISGIKIPQISESRKQELCETYEEWGKYGWTIIPYAQLSLYNQAPTSQKESNKIAMAYCKDSDMLNLFEKTKELKGVKLKDYTEAVYDYQHKQYKSCAMILFSLLDAKLIRMQKKADINPKTKRRDSGIRAAENIKKRIEKEQDINKKLFLLLSHKNLFACISTFFAGGDDFKVQPELANRNFIDHGMMTKNVRKRDCIQLFLLYFNFLEFFEIINSK